MDKAFKIGVLVLGTIFLILYFIIEFNQSSGNKSIVANTHNGIIGILKSITSPLQLFTLIILIGITTITRLIIKKEKSELYKYCIHMFLAIIAAITSIALWSPQSFYRPEELTDNFSNYFHWYTALPPTLFFLLGAGAYLYYQSRLKK